MSSVVGAMVKVQPLPEPPSGPAAEGGGVAPAGAIVDVASRGSVTSGLLPLGEGVGRCSIVAVVGEEVTAPVGSGVVGTPP